MPNIANDNNSKMSETVNQMSGDLSVSTKPTVICGVQRKANIGNYENIDVYAAVSLPVDIEDIADEAKLFAAVEAAADKCMRIAAQETKSAYNKIKGTH